MMLVLAFLYKLDLWNEIIIINFVWTVEWVSRENGLIFQLKEVQVVFKLFTDDN